MAFEQMVFGTARFLTSRYSHYEGRDSGERMLIFLRDPRKVHEIIGREKVLAAVQEIAEATRPDELPGKWTSIAGEPYED